MLHHGAIARLRRFVHEQVRAALSKRGYTMADAGRQRAHHCPRACYAAVREQTYVFDNVPYGRRTACRAFVAYSDDHAFMRVTMTRIAPLLVDDDNLTRSSLKACRDAIADALGLTDDKPISHGGAVEWVPVQERSPKEWTAHAKLTGNPNDRYALKIRIEPLPG